MCVQLNLTWAVKDGEGFFVPIAQCFVKPVEILQKKAMRYEVTGLEYEIFKNHKIHIAMKKFVCVYSKQAIRPPLGPSPISSITSSKEMRSLMSTSGSNVNSSAAGSRFT